MFACVLTSSNMNTMIALTHSLCDGLVSISRTFACLLFVVFLFMVICFPLYTESLSLLDTLALTISNYTIL